jgi:hypothetical protein
MGSNSSLRALRAHVLSEPLEIYADHVLEIDCGTPGCRHDRAYHVGSLADDFPGRTVGWVLARLVCQDCGKRPAEASLVRRVGVARPKAVRIWLVGNSAYR